MSRKEKHYSLGDQLLVVITVVVVVIVIITVVVVVIVIITVVVTVVVYYCCCFYCCCLLLLLFRNVPYDADEEELNGFMERFGHVRYCRLVQGGITGMCRG